jgi:hypothetical protein
LSKSVSVLAVSVFLPFLSFRLRTVMPKGFVELAAGEKPE